MSGTRTRHEQVLAVETLQDRMGLIRDSHTRRNLSRRFEQFVNELNEAL